MILLRPADPDQPITISNAIAVELEEPPEAWLAAQAAYIIESTNVTVETTP